MSEDSINAYDRRARVAEYDADMEVMHPNRSRMLRVMLEVLALPMDQAVTIVDVGAGTGYLTAGVVSAYPKGHVIAVDGAAAMLETARARLGERSKRVSFRVGTFAEIARQVADRAPADAVLSAYSLHHLSAPDKLDTLQQCLEVLKPRGWFLNGDLVVAESAEVERCIQEIRVRGVVSRARQGDDRFADMETTRRFLDELEASEGDQPLTLREDLRLLHEAGYDSVSVFWKEYREVVCGGRKPA